jgi:hypothetical protein
LCCHGGWSNDDIPNRATTKTPHLSTTSLHHHLQSPPQLLPQHRRLEQQQPPPRLAELVFVSLPFSLVAAGFLLLLLCRCDCDVVMAELVTRGKKEGRTKKE